jgi:DnaD/phage-associated family protein
MYADENGWCFPMLSTLGNDLGKSKQAVGRDTIALRKLGYLEVTARYDKNGARRSSLYRLRFDTPVNIDDSTPSTPDVDGASTSGVDVNGPSNVPDEAQNVFAVYENEIGPITPHLADELVDAERIHGAKWVCDALKVASSNGKRNWAYAKAVLTRWGSDGYGVDKNKKNNETRQSYRTRKEVPERTIPTLERAI